MAFKKIGRMKVNTKVKGKHGQDTGFVFYSYDKGSVALRCNLLIEFTCQIFFITNEIQRLIKCRHKFNNYGMKYLNIRRKFYERKHESCL